MTDPVRFVQRNTDSAGNYTPALFHARAQGKRSEKTAERKSPGIPLPFRLESLLR